MIDEKRLKELFFLLTNIDLKKINFLDIDEQIRISLLTIFDINVVISNLNKKEYIDYLYSIINNMTLYPNYFKDLAVLFGKSIYLFFGCSEVFFIYYKYLELLELNTSYKKTIFYHKNNVVDAYIKYYELFEDEYSKKNYVFFTNEKLKTLIEKPEINIDESFFEKFYLKKMLSFEMSNRNFELITTSPTTLNDIFSMSDKYINNLTLPARALVITKLLYDFNRKLNFGNEKGNVELLKYLIKLAEEFLQKTIDLSEEIHPLCYLRHISMIECINSIKLMHNLECKDAQVDLYIKEVMFLINNKLHIFSVLKLQRTIDQIIKIKNISKFFNINVDIDDIYISLMSDYKKMLPIFDSKKILPEDCWLSYPFEGTSFFVKDETGYYKESIRHLRECWKLISKTTNDDSFYIDYIL